jgi:cobalt-zinc-cadmium resistance protein CzcA
MIASLLEFSLRQRILVLGFTGLLAVAGVYAFQSIPIDAYPDVTNIQVQVLAEAPGLSPVEVERFITYPLELQMTGLPGLAEIRSLSKFALSQITVVFDDDVDVYFARQLVIERILAAKERLPEGIEPVMAPVSTGLGEVYQYYLEGPKANEPDPKVVEAELTDQRTLQDWVLRPLLKSVSGVIDVNGMGGFVKQYQVLVDPAKLRKYDLTLHEVYDAVAKNNANAGGNVLERHSERAIVRGLGLIKAVGDIESIIVKESGGTPVFVRDLAEVRIGHAVRHGAVVLNGEREVVAATVLMLRGGNAREVVRAVKAKVEDLEQNHVLPAGSTIKSFYDRIDLVTEAINTVRDALIEGVLLVVFVFFFFLGHVRSAIIVTATLIVTPLVTFIVMQRLGLSANLMTLGGLAIAIGEIADGSLVVVENVYRHLAANNRSPRKSKLEVILQATKEVGRPILFGILVISVVFLPLMTLHGMEGKMFAPLAYTLVIALLASVVVTLTLSPVLCSVLLRGDHPEETRLTLWMKQRYRPVLGWTLQHRSVVLLVSSGLVLASLVLVPFVGREFIPILLEGALTPQVVRLPSVSLPESIEIEKQTQRAMLEFPEVKMAVSKIGRADIALGPEEPNESDPIVSLRDRNTWTTASTQSELTDAIRKKLAEIPGISVLMSQPIQERVDELISGIRTECAIKLFGDDLEVLRQKADEIADVMRDVKGVKDVKVEQIAGQPYLTVDIDRQKIARFGINVADVQDIITTAIGGKPATYVFEGERRFQLILRFPEPYRNSVGAIGDIRVKSFSGAFIPMSDLAKIDMREGPLRISREQVKRRIYIGFNVVGSDIGSVVDEGRKKLARIRLPEGYTISWGGAFENMERANARLLIVVPITLGLVFFLLFWAFHSMRYATLIILNLPFALIGGVVSLWLSGQYLSVPASIGFIELFGLAVGNGIVLVSYVNQLRNEGQSTNDAILAGCTLRLRPVVMTMMTTLLGLLPLALATGIGAEVQRPLATVVIGGLFTSTALTLVVLPALYGWMAEKEAGKEHAPEWM